eukprot:3027337-Rhodomonas_salina.2
MIETEKQEVKSERRDALVSQKKFSGCVHEMIRGTYNLQQAVERWKMRPNEGWQLSALAWQ